MRRSAHYGVGLLVMLAALGGCDPGRETARSPDAASASASPPSAAASEGLAPPTPAQSAAPATGEALPSTRESGEPTPNDSALAAKIEAALAAETALHGASIAVKAADGVVTLSGSTKDPGLRSMAAQVALSVPGVRSVRNELTISADV